MKQIVEYIKESSETIKIQNLKLTYKVRPYEFIVCVPNSFSESDMQVYLDDKCLKDLPGSNSKSKDMLGENIKQISDIYFKYSGFSASDSTDSRVSLEWDPKFSTENETSEYTYYRLNDLKYIMEFSEFNIKKSDNIKEDLKKIFRTFNSNSSNIYPINIELENVEYDE